MTSMRQLRKRDRVFRRYLARYGAPTGWHSLNSGPLGVLGVPAYWANRSRLVFHPQGGPAFIAAETRRRVRRTAGSQPSEVGRG